ncbi:S49 family peptidase [Aureimonas altamirensis]|uniref:S49 family peptidase n=1 Tax=Aureimonas altamirensis TaxID=370622 RepID=UPI001E491CD8|nr:S49 family peptidase [Aureimonas altamirensis]UHD47316.1 S49 family peptidase [Aureimonas altamirensis]
MAKALQRFLPKRFRKQRTVVPVVRLTGMIAAESGGIGRKALSMATVEPLLDKAFEIKDAPVVAIEVNSPGGSPVQSRLIFRRIRELAEKHDRKVLVFCEDVAASGGYMIACAGDEIVADPSSIVGSIGVVSGGFGFVDLIRRIGVERRLYTAGRNKATLDPFSPEKPEDVEHLKSLQLDVHETFIELVRERRAGRLKEDEPDLFSGQFWSARRGMELGLVDRLGTLHEVLSERFGPDVELERIRPRRGLLGGRIGFGADAAGAAAERLAGVAEERALWARYGL